MSKARLEAFSDGVIAIIITIMVLELKVPHDAATFEGLRPLVPVFLAYVLSFVYVGIYWNNHHHMMHAAPRISGGVLWANLHVLFWLSLIPFVTGWMGENHVAPIPTALYGVVLLGAAIAFVIMQSMLIRVNGPDGVLARALGGGRDKKGLLSLALYACGIGLAFVNAYIACALYAGVAALWLIPDRRVERLLAEGEGS